MSVYVFLGSTLTPGQAKAHLDAVYLPPVQQGDVIRLLAENPRVIGIVDGLFRTVPSVWHKEILVALERGVHVFGAASMGALRAAELSRFGMRGVGQIYERYADGTFEDDDEVAVAHASAEFGFRELSVAMVNIRDAVDLAVAAGVLEPAEGEALLRHAKGVHYTRRSFDALVSHAKTLWPEAKAEALASSFAAYGPSRKQRDAIAMLQAIAALVKEDPPPYVGAAAVEQTPFLSALRDDAEERRTPRRILDDDASTAAAGVPLWALRKEALTQILGRDSAARLGVTVSDDELNAARQAFRNGATLDGPAAEAEWLAREGMTAHMLEGRLRDVVRLQKLEQHYCRRVDVELPDLAAVLAALLVR